MRVAVLSDTHLVSPDHWFEEVFQRHLAPADVVLHCGDVTGHDVLYYLMGHPAFYAVAGNMDGWVLSDDLPPTRRLEFEGVRIGMAHGWGFHGPDIGASVVRSFAPEVDLVCFGHTHVYQWSECNGVRVLNPGSVTKPRQGKRSLAMLTLEKGKDPQAQRIDLW